MKKQLIIFSIATMISLSGCGNNTSPENDANINKETRHKETNHVNMNHSGSGVIPEGLKTEKNPTYKVGSKAIIKEAHMEGMEGAEATIVGAYDTIVYTISYTPTTGGKRVENHKWVIHEEIKDAGEEPFETGAEVTVNASHMEGMKDVTAEIDSAERMTVYMVDFTPTDDSKKVTNHMWVTENELASIKELVHDYSVGTIKKQSASITFEQLIVTDNDKKQRTYELPKDEFFVSIAPYVKETHPCAIHSLTGCRGEMVHEKFSVYIKDEKGNVIIDQTMTSQANGFIDIWLPRNKNYDITITHDGKTAKSEFSTFENKNTCITTMQLTENKNV